MYAVGIPPERRENPNVKSVPSGSNTGRYFFADLLKSCASFREEFWAIGGSVLKIRGIFPVSEEKREAVYRNINFDCCEIRRNGMGG